MSDSIDTGSDGAAQSQQYVDLRNLAGALAPPTEQWAKFIKGVVVSVQTVNNQSTCTVQLGGDTSTSIPGVRLLDSYSPVAGDTVQIGMQGSDIFIIGQIMNTTPGADTANGWVTPSLGSGFTSMTNDPVKWRVVVDNGDRKIQIRGGVNVSGSPTTLWTMPTAVRPMFNKPAMVVGRNDSGGSSVASLQIAGASSGVISLASGTTGVRGSQTAVGGGSAVAQSSTATLSTGQPLGALGGYPENGISGTGGVFFGDPSTAHKHGMDHYHSIVGHSHSITGLSHQHPLDQVLYPTEVSFNGIEYFL